MAPEGDPAKGVSENGLLGENHAAEFGYVGYGIVPYSNSLEDPTSFFERKNG